MILSDTYLATKAKISAHLAQLGWSVEEAGTICVGKKTYQTAVGEKEAIAYLAPTGEDAAYFNASYESEGRNVLSNLRTGWKPITSADSCAQLESLTVSFSAEVDQVVSQTYAMRLAAARS